jgi:phosphate/sulfate permease
MVPKPANIKKSAFWGAVMGAGYFLVIQFLWKSANTTVLANVIIAAVSCILFAAIIYFTDRYKYQRYLRKKNASPK